MIYRQNPVLPPHARSASALRAFAVLEAAARHVLAADERLLARHVLDMASMSEAAEKVLSAAWRLAFSCPSPAAVAPLGSGRRYARDGGGRVLAVVEAWASSYLASLEGRRELPYDTALRAAWDAAHPEWGRFFSRAIGALSAADTGSAAEELGVWKALEQAICSDAAVAAVEVEKESRLLEVEDC